MWASGLWLPGWLSPECLVWYWLAGLGLGLAASQTERPELATLLTRLVLRLAAAHSVVVGLAYGYVLRTPSSAHVNEVYVVAAALNGLLLVGSVGWLVISAVRTPEVLLSYPAVGASTSRVRVFLWWGAVPLIVAGSYVGFAVVGRGVVHFVNGEHALDLVSVTLAFVLTALVCFANLWRGASTTTAQALGILALGGALLA